jgi:hypothetical protein
MLEPDSPVCHKLQARNRCRMMILTYKQSLDGFENPLRIVSVEVVDVDSLERDKGHESMVN